MNIHLTISCFQSAPALDNISEDEQMPPKLPIKRKSAISSHLSAVKYDEAIGENLSQHGMQLTSAFEVNMRPEGQINEVEEHNGTLENEQRRERPRSLPPDNTDAAAVPIPTPRLKSETSETRPIPKPRPKTMILKHDSSGQILKYKTMSAEDLLKTIPAVDRVRSGSEVGSNVPPVPLKRAQMYRSQEGISHSTVNNSKESKF